MPRGSRRGRPRGEVNEIISQLEHLSMKDGRKPEVVQSKRDCFQKLIKYMTTGIDMSPAFVPATKCVALSKFDLPLKKMLYLYLRTAARHNSAVALLVVQTLLNDCKDLDPTIRGLAVRSMCSLRVPDLMENVYQAVEGGLKDAHPYVREAAVMGVLKCYHQDQPGAKLRNLPEAVLEMMQSDTDPQVVANCLYVLQQLGALEGIITRPLVVALLNHIRAFSDWAQCLVIEVLRRYYRPATEEERFDMLEVLDFGLNHVNSAVVMATVKLFLHYTAGYPEQYGQVLTSIRGPMQTLIQGRESEVVHAVLCNVLVLANRHPEAFTQLSTDFFCRPEDPSYLKLLKIDALIATATASNAYDAAEEASQYARDRDTDVAQAGVQAISKIAIKVPEVDGIIDRLLLFLNHPRAPVSSQALVAMVDVLRRFPDAAEACMDAIASVDASALTLPAGKAGFCWALGEFGDRVQDSPYVLEGLAAKFSEEDELVKTALLTATTRLFLKRPPECKPALSAVLTAALKDPCTAVRERAAFYQRILSSATSSSTPSAAVADFASALDITSPISQNNNTTNALEKAKSIITARPPPVSSFEDSLAPEVRDKIFDELNTLSVVYNAPAATFIDEEELHFDHTRRRIHNGGSIGAGSDEDIDDMVVPGGGGVDDGTALLLDLEAEGGHGDLSGGTTDGGFDLGAELMSLNLNNNAHGGGGGPSSSSSIKGDVVTGPLTGLMDVTGLGSFGLSPEQQLHQQQAAGLAPMSITSPAQMQGSTTTMATSGSGALDADMFGGLLGGSSIDTSGLIPNSGGGGGGNTVLDSTAGLAQGLDDLLGGGLGIASPAPQHHHHHHQQQQGVSLIASPQALSAQDFQQLWNTWEPLSKTFQQTLDNSAIKAIEARVFKDFVAHVGQANIASFATPREGSSAPYRFIFHAQAEESRSHVLAQVTVTKAPSMATVVVKSDNAGAAQHVVDALQSLLLSI